MKVPPIHKAAVVIACATLGAFSTTFANEDSLTDLDADALEVRKLWNIAADSSLRIRQQTADWMPETKAYFKSTFDWRHCLRKKTTPTPTRSVGNTMALMDPGLEPDHPKHAESTNQFNPSAIYRRSPPIDSSSVGRRIGLPMPKLLLEFAENYKACKNSFKKVIAFKAKSNQPKFENSVDRLTAIQRVRAAEAIHNDLKKSIDAFSDLAGEEATRELIKDLEAGKYNWQL